MLIGGNAADSPVASHLLVGLKGARYLLADKGYDANSLRKHLRERAIVPIIPGRSNRKRQTRYNKLARNFLSAVALACPRRILAMNTADMLCFSHDRNV